MSKTRILAEGPRSKLLADQKGSFGLSTQGEGCQIYICQQARGWQMGRRKGGSRCFVHTEDIRESEYAACTAAS